jgi:signal transduction histidine kinase
MRDLSLHLMDIVQNSIRAEAKLVSIRMSLDDKGVLAMTVEDDGVGMDRELLNRVQNPFATTRTERKVGLGLSLLTENARKTGGSVHVKSEPGKGTIVTAIFHTDHIDCLPVGNIVETLLALILACPDGPEFTFRLAAPAGEASLDTRVIREALMGLSLNDSQVLHWIRQSLREETQPIFGGIRYEIHR